MKCPKCNVEGIIKNSHIVANERGEEFKRVIYFCKNKNCALFDKEIGDKTRRIVTN